MPVLGLNAAALNSTTKSYNAAFQRGFDKVTAQYLQVATAIPSSGSENIYPFLSQWPSLREWIGDRVFKSLKASGYSLPNRDFESSVAVPANAFKDDQVGLYAPMMEFMGDSAARFPDELVFAALAAGASSTCFDGQYFFDTDHQVAGVSKDNYDSTGAGALWCLLDTRRPLKPLIFQDREKISFTSFTKPDDEHVFKRNEFLFGAQGRCAAGYGFWQMAYGSLNTLDSTNVLAYRAKMMALKSDEGVPLNVVPNLCVVGPSNEAKANALFKTQINGSGATNPLYNMCEIVVTPYLP